MKAILKTVVLLVVSGVVVAAVVEMGGGSDPALQARSHPAECINGAEARYTAS